VKNPRETTVSRRRALFRRDLEERDLEEKKAKTRCRSLLLNPATGALNPVRPGRKTEPLLEDRRAFAS